MNAEQMQKWKAIREKGRKAYLLKRTLLWGTIWSFVVIGRSELRSRFYARQIAKMTMDAIFGQDRNSPAESPIVYYLTSYYDEAIECFLLAWFVALAIWTYKEQYYSAYISPKASDY
jgi:hypothetical protein